MNEEYSAVQYNVSASYPFFKTNGNVFLNGNCSKNVMLVYICVSVVLTWSQCRKEREKLDITLDSTVFACRVMEI